MKKPIYKHWWFWLLAVVLVSNLATSFSSQSSHPSSIRVAETSQPLEVRTLISIVQNSLDKTWIGEREVEYDPDSRVVIVRLWAHDMSASMLDMALVDVKYLTSWRETLEGFRSLGETIQRKFDESGHDVSVVLYLYEPDGEQRLWAAVERGEVVFDIIDSTPPGERLA